MDKAIKNDRQTKEKGVESYERWSPQRLISILEQELGREKIYILANREPYVHRYQQDGTIGVSSSSGGLVTALEPIMRACSGVWIAHGHGDADVAISDPHGRIRVPPQREDYTLRRVWLTPEEEKGYYWGCANEALWPLFHLADVRPIFRKTDWHCYQQVNQKFIEALCREVDSDADAPVVLVQDYHFALAPAYIRTHLPHATTVFFWHIPWPNAERFSICPWKRELLEGMLGADILGFQTSSYCNYFLDAVEQFLEARTDRAQNTVFYQGQQTRIRPYPISIEWPIRWLEDIPSLQECRAAVLQELGLSSDALLGVGVDRLDYIKGVEERLRAVERLLERSPELQGRFTFVQLSAPSRTDLESYRTFQEHVGQQVDHINQRFGTSSYRPILVLKEHHEASTVFRYYRAAHVCYVSSLHDGMNLVSKEFIASRDDEQGVLVLSQFTGAARELTEALIVNPYDIEQASCALACALSMPPEEQKKRMRSMRTTVAEFNVYRWAGKILMDTAHARTHRQLGLRSKAALHSKKDSSR